MKPSDTRMVLAEFDDGSFALGNFGKVVFYHVKNGMVQSTPDVLVRRWLDFGDGSRTAIPAIPALAADVLTLLALYEASQAALTGALAECLELTGAIDAVLDRERETADLAVKYEAERDVALAELAAARAENDQLTEAVSRFQRVTRYLRDLVAKMPGGQAMLAEIGMGDE